MIDLGISKLAMIGVVALIVIGPEKLPRVARTVGTLLGKAQRYISDVKSEVSRSMELDELRKAKEGFEGAVKDATKAVESSGKDFEESLSEATKGLESSEVRPREILKNLTTAIPISVKPRFTRHPRSGGGQNSLLYPSGLKPAAVAAHIFSQARRAWLVFAPV